MTGIIKRKIKTAMKLVIQNPQQLVVILSSYGLFRWLPDDVHLKLVYRAEMGKKLNLEMPILFSEKLQWLKLHDRKYIYTKLVDKFAIRHVIEEKFGKSILIPLIGVYNSPSEIPWDALPEKFVIKCTHGSGCNLVCKDISQLNILLAEKQLLSWMNKNWYQFGREWPYKNVPPRIIIEKYMTDNVYTTDLTDFKFYCFEGKPHYCQVISGRHMKNGHSSYYIDFYDMKWHHLPFTGMNAPRHPYPPAPQLQKKPSSFNEMFRIAQEMAKDIHFVRVDFYEIESKPYFGEFTLYPLSGFGEFEPKVWNHRMGCLIKI